MLATLLSATVVGLEPSCLLSARDEFLVMGLGDSAERFSARALMVEEFLAGVSVLPLTSEVARIYGRIRAELETAGTPIGPLDLMIASQAVALRATLITNNTREFKRIGGLRFRDWTV